MAGIPILVVWFLLTGKNECCGLMLKSEMKYIGKSIFFRKCLKQEFCLSFLQWSATGYINHSSGLELGCFSFLQITSLPLSHFIFLKFTFCIRKKNNYNALVWFIYCVESQGHHLFIPASLRVLYSLSLVPQLGRCQSFHMNTCVPYPCYVWFFGCRLKSGVVEPHGGSVFKCLRNTDFCSACARWFFHQ